MKKRLFNLDWADLKWHIFGYLALGILVMSAAMAILQGRQMALVNCLAFSTLLLLYLPPHVEIQRKNIKSWIPLALFTLYLAIAIVTDGLLILGVLNIVH